MVNYNSINGNVVAHGVQVANSSANGFISTTLSNGELLIGSTGSAPVAATLTAGGSLQITNNAGSVIVGSTLPKITRFSSSGTWTKDPNAKWVKVILWGGGGGGQSGARQAVGVQASGGQGGRSGITYIGESPADQFGTTEVVTIGAGGQGGVVPGDNSAPANPTAAGLTYFGDFVALGGNTGLPLLNNGDGSTNCTSGAQSFGGNGTNPPNISSNGQPYYNLPSRYVGSVGGGGGGISAAEATQAGGNGLSQTLYDLTFSNVVIAGGAGGAVGSNGSPGNPYTAKATGGFQASTGGGGGGSATVGAAGNGGNGAAPGAGGGGGGASRNGMTGGSGGNGGDGAVWIFEF